jgi:glycerol-3-phosphate dehydrogenase
MVLKNPHFDPVRKGIPVLSENETTGSAAAMIAQNPDYGVIVCRCEEISRGEILDALRAPIMRAHAGRREKAGAARHGPVSGRLLFAAGDRDNRRISGRDSSEVKKSADGANIAFGRTK